MWFPRRRQKRPLLRTTAYATAVTGPVVDAGGEAARLAGWGRQRQQGRAPIGMRGAVVDGDA